MPEPFAAQGRPLDKQLRQPAGQDAQGHRVDRRQAQPHQHRHRDDCRDDAGDVEQRWCQGRQEVAVQRVQHAHAGRRQGDQCQKRQHHARQLDGQLELAGHRGVVAGQQPDQRVGEHHPEHDQPERHDEQRVEDVAAKPPGRGLAVAGEVFRERGDKRGAHRALREEVADEVGDAERDVERVDGVARAEQVGHHLFADQPEDPAGHRGRANQPRRARQFGGCGGRGHPGPLHYGPKKRGPRWPADPKRRMGPVWKSHPLRRRRRAQKFSGTSYFSCALTASLTSLPSTLAPASPAIAAFITLPKSLALVAPVAAMAAATASAMASGLADGGRNRSRIRISRPSLSARSVRPALGELLDGVAALLHEHRHHLQRLPVVERAALLDFLVGQR